jgi:hypothetical protein
MIEDKLDRVFDSIVREVEEEMEEDEDNAVSVAIIEDKAYWVIDNMFYQADITMDGEIDKSSSRPVNAFDLSNKDVTKMILVRDYTLVHDVFVASFTIKKEGTTVTGIDIDKVEAL